jgi:hypothetical protein
MGGSEREVEATNFKVTVDGESVVGELGDFQSVLFSLPGGKPTLTLQAPGGTPVSGPLTLSAKDDKGDHEAREWLIAIDLPNRRTLAVKNAAWKLERRPTTR